MPTISNVSFGVNILRSAESPAIVLTDTTDDRPEGMVGIFSITQPDGYTRTGNIGSPDIDIDNDYSTYNYQLRLDSSGDLQCGTYRIVYSANAPGYLSTDFVREFVLDYSSPDMVLREEFDVFTPKLEYYDDTEYEVDGWIRTGSFIQDWQWSSEPGGSGDSYSEESGVVPNTSIEITPAYDAYYEISKTSIVNYQSEAYPWLTLSDTSITKTVSTYAKTPPTINEIIALLSDLSDEVNMSDCGKYVGRCEFTYAQSLFDLIVYKIRTEQTDGIYEDLKKLLLVLVGYIAYEPTNEIIPPYVLPDFGSDLPDQALADQKVLTSDGSSASWQWSRVTKVFDFIVGTGSTMEDGDTTLSSMMITDREPMVFVDGVLLTWVSSSDRRYASIDIPNTITINGGVNEGENVQVYL